MIGLTSQNGHLVIISDLADVQAFSQDHRLVTGELNLALHLGTIGPELQNSISAFIASAIDTFQRKMFHTSGVTVMHDFHLGSLNANTDEKLAIQWLDEAAITGVNLAEAKIMPLALDIVSHVRNFALTWPQETAPTQSKPTFPFNQPVNYVRTQLVLEINEPLFFGKPVFMDPYGSEETPQLFGEVNYAGQGMIWFSNSNVERVARDINAPQVAKIIKHGQFNFLNQGEAAFFTGNRETGLAIYPGMPLRGDTRPSLNLSQTRHIHQPQI